MITDRDIRLIRPKNPGIRTYLIGAFCALCILLLVSSGILAPGSLAAYRAGNLAVYVAYFLLLFALCVLYSSAHDSVRFVLYNSKFNKALALYETLSAEKRQNSFLCWCHHPESTDLAYIGKEIVTVWNINQFRTRAYDLPRSRIIVIKRSYHHREFRYETDRAFFFDIRYSDDAGHEQHRKIAVAPYLLARGATTYGDMKEAFLRNGYQLVPDEAAQKADAKAVKCARARNKPITPIGTGK
jgi:hypothetical protein